LINPTSTITYNYEDSIWKDKLTKYDGKSITYDDIGNPLTYDGWNYTWDGGRQLKNMTKGTTVLDYKYNDEGIRTSKMVNGVETKYTLIDGRITSQTTNGNAIYFRYDGNNELVSLNYNDNEYFYIKNVQGDIIGIVDEDGNLVVEYTYDAWGKLLTTTGSLASTVGAINPFRYRGYRYDTETGLLYVGSRYYDPEVGRFINADDTSVLSLTQGELLGANLFAYCNNNPVMNSDPSGYIKVKTSWWGLTLSFSGRETEGLLWALVAGSGASWLAAELGAPTIIGGLSFGVLAAILTTVTGIIGLINWKNHGKGFSIYRTWLGQCVLW